MLSGFSDLSVHLVEPSPTQARLMAAMLEGLGVREVNRFLGAKDVLAAMRHGTPAVVISAYYLGDMTGPELVRTMRENRRLEHVPFILVSSETRPQMLEPVRQSGACGIVPKPCSEVHLRRALQATLDYLDSDAAIDGGTAPIESLRVLIVDDSISARRFIRRVLENLGIRHFSEAENGLDAARQLESAIYDLVVTDYNMPEMDGKALLDFIRHESWQKSIPVVMVTSESDEGRLAAVEEAGVSGICDKPFEPAVVEALLRRIMRAG